ncbi:uncharacterized protein LOC135340942 isoform X2 [Halichondria panicea]|uniref:uncharacterized protein LOC135340942 isoform X2 n=1 Tax=Halichondria panicea TaxID=6063 RepID=UPI00312BA908
MDALIEPLPCWGPFSAAADGRHYVWRGAGPGLRGSNIIVVCDPSTELWSLLPTTGPLPPGEWGGFSACVGRCLYTFGGYDGSSYFNDVSKLDLDTLQWTKVQSSDNQPMKKAGCGLICVNDKTLCCIGGYGIEGPTQPGSTFTSPWSDGRGWTNEFHFFDIQNGVWSSPKLRGKRPPPCSGFTFTMMDQHRAVLFGGFKPGLGGINDVYLFDFRTMGEPWPVGRSSHASCCLNYGQDHPQLLVYGGLGNKTLGDMWILDVDTGKWTEVTLPESMAPRHYHSITATSLGPGLTEVLVFGGRREMLGKEISETTILRFELTVPLASVAGPSAKKWALVGVAHNDTRGSAQRLGEKIGQIIARASLFSDHSSQDRVRALKQQLRAAEQREHDTQRRHRLQLHEKDRKLATKERELVMKDQQFAQASRRHGDVERQLREAQQISQEELAMKDRELAEANRRREDAEERAQLAEQREQVIQNRSEQLLQEKNQVVEIKERESYEANHHRADVERRNQELIAENGRLDRRAQLAEERAQGLETQWVVHREEITMTERQLGGGGWGVVKVAKFREIEVAAKTLYEQIRSDYYRHLFIREMNMAARLRHPHLVQFIGATLEGEMIILTELMATSLRRVLEGGRISREHILSISVQVCQALNYLHLMQPDPVIHRDISSANVLLNPLPDGRWSAKVTDYGSVNTQRMLNTMNPGSPVYAAPEAGNPSLQSSKMDVFSLGVLLIEMCSGQFPSDDGRERLLLTIQDRQFSDIISRCIDRERDNRPTAQQLLNELQ